MVVVADAANVGVSEDIDGDVKIVSDRPVVVPVVAPVVVPVEEAVIERLE